MGSAPTPTGKGKQEVPQEEGQSPPHPGPDPGLGAVCALPGAPSHLQEGSEERAAVGGLFPLFQANTDGAIYD